MPVNASPSDFPAEATRTDAVYEQILVRIVRGEVVGGEELKSTQLAEALGVSRTPVLQALQRLAADGLVVLELNKRALVRPGAENWLLELHQMREWIEPPAAALAALRMDAARLLHLRALAGEARPGSRRNWAAAARQFDFALHLAVADYCGNFAAGETLRKIWTFKRVSYLAAPQNLGTLRTSHSEHLSILQALEQRDPRTAEAAMLFHLRSAGNLRQGATII